MAFRVEHKAFTTPEEAVRIVEAAGMEASEVNAGAQDLDTHWHAMDLVTCVLEGDITITDEENGQVYVCGPGDTIFAEARTLHSEKTGGLKAVAGNNKRADDDGPFIRPPEEARQ